MPSNSRPSACKPRPAVRSPSAARRTPWIKASIRSSSNTRRRCRPPRLRRAEELCLAALNDTPFDLDATLKELRDLDEDIRLGPSTGAIVSAALARGIPYRRLTQGSLVQFGWGSKQKRIQAAETSQTSAIAESIAQDKELTKKLHASGVAVPYGRPEDEDDAWLAALEVGLPVVVKPQDGNQGKGISVNLTTEEQVRRPTASPSSSATTSWSRNSCPATTGACWSSATS
jgi:hypothetical protein